MSKPNPPHDDGPVAARRVWLVGETGDAPPDVYLDEDAARAAVEAEWRDYFDNQLTDSQRLHNGPTWEAFWRSLSDTARSPIAVEVRTRLTPR